MDFNLDEQIKSITSQIIEKYKPDKIILFGSAARGEFSDESDVDFMVLKQDTPYLGAERIRELSRLITRDIPVDFLIYRPDEFEGRLSMGDPFLKSIIKEGIVLYG